jgi:hypothetical protein
VLRAKGCTIAEIPFSVGPILPFLQGVYTGSLAYAFHYKIGFGTSVIVVKPVGELFLSFT